MKEQTKIIHKNIFKNKPYISPPISKASTIVFKKIEDLYRFKSYGLEGTNTSDRLEEKINIIERSKYTSLYPSGLSAIMNVYFSLLNKDDIVVLPNNVYYPHERGAKWFTKKIGAKLLFYKTSWNLKKFRKKFKSSKSIKIIWVEIPGSITFECVNIDCIKFFSKEKKSILVIDNTYSSGYRYKPILDGFDISVLALTKFYSGNNDILLGSISTRNKNINKKILISRKNLGIGVSFEDCYLAVRNLNTINIRIKIHDRNSCLIVNWIRKKKFVKNVFFPKDNDNFRKKISLSSGLFSIIFKKKIIKKKIFKFLNNLKLFKIGYSWGGSVSLVMFYEKNRLFKNKYILRFFVGLENYKDLILDLKKSFKKANIY